MRVEGSYVKSVFSSYVVTILQMCVGLFLTPFILAYITKEEFGAYTLLIESIAFLGLFNFGFGGALSAYAAQNTDNISLISRYASVTATLQVLLALLGLVICSIISVKVDAFFPENSIQQLGVIILVFGLGFFFSMVARTYSNLLFALRQVHVDNQLRIFGILLRASLVVILLQQNFGILGLAIASVSVEVLLALLAFYRVKSFFPEISIRYFDVDYKALKALWNKASWFFIGSVSVLLIERFDKILTGSVLGVEDVAILAVTGRLFEIGKSLLYSFSNNFRPYFGKLIEIGDKDKASKYHSTLQVLSTAGAILIASIIVYVLKSFISLWVGSGFYGGVYLSVALGLNLVYQAWKLPSRAYLSANLVIRQQSVSGLIEGLLITAVGYFLGREYGLAGLVVSTAIIGFLFQAPYYSSLLIKGSLDTFNGVRQRNLKLLLTLVTIGLITSIFMEYMGIDVLLNTGSILKIILLLFVNFMVTFVLFFNDLYFIKNVIKSL